MKPDVTGFLRCADCRQELAVSAGKATRGEILEGTLTCAGCGTAFPVVRGVPRFVPAANYASSFGFQWNAFRRTQLDSCSGVPISRTRFFSQSGWRPEDLRGRIVLDAGCGAGRFAEVALDAGAVVVAIDYSSAVDACWTNLGGHSSLHVVQADIFRLPFAHDAFDYVYSFGVLQHTPDPARAFQALVPFVRPGGQMAIDVYPATPLNLLWPKYWLRPLTKRLSAVKLHAFVRLMVDWLLPLSTALGHVPRIGRRLRYAVPVVNYRGVLPLNDTQIREWAVLDTFDMLAPAHDHPRSLATVRRWFESAGFADVHVSRPGLVVGRGRRT